LTGIGPVGVRQPRVRDRGAADDAGSIRFTPAILPPYARRSRSLEVLTVVALHPGARVTPIAAGNARKCWSLGAGNQVTSVTRFFAGPREIRS